MIFRAISIEKSGLLQGRLISVVGNGGLVGYYYAANNILDAIEDLKKVKADVFVEMLEIVNELFLKECTSEEFYMKDIVINMWNCRLFDIINVLNEKFYYLDEGLELQLIKYIDK